MDHSHPGLYGRAKIYKSGPVYEEIWNRLIEAEKKGDPEKKGYAVLVAIDEYRKDFARVKWGGSSLPPNRPGELDIFQQIWFAGNHADIGGSYPEVESRLSDISLQWMVDFITKELPEEGRVEVDPDYMTLFPSPDGMMHDECMVGIGGTPAHWYPADRDVPADAILHPTVYERLALANVRNYSSYGKYRPAPLRNHHEAKKYFEEELKPK